ncbi:MAG: hypothetical protein ACJAUL_003752 [Paraglaciecola sp.]|jgi:hypothetical protein
MNIIKALLISMITLTIIGTSGCANMDQAECKTANWQAIGYEDGSVGARDSQFSQHRQECAEYGVTANIDDYLRGHGEGSKKYCTQINGFFLGMKGKNYNRNCPEALAPIFLNGLTDGKQVYSAQRVMDSTDDALERLYARIENIKEVIVDKNNLMIADGLVRAERLELRQQIESLEISMVELINLIPDYQDKHSRAIERYDKVKLSFTNYF